MIDKEHVFARFQDSQPSSGDRREQRVIPRRGSTGNRVVEVVHVKSGAPPRTGAASQKQNTKAQGLRAASWEDGFTARQVTPPPVEEPRPAAPAQPTIHVMPMWEQAGPEEDRPASAAPAPAPDHAATTRPRARRAGTAAPRRVADPFDAQDDGANCLRCGYLVEAERDRRGLMTCAACG